MLTTILLLISASFAGSDTTEVSVNPRSGVTASTLYAATVMTEVGSFQHGGETYTLRCKGSGKAKNKAVCEIRSGGSSTSASRMTPSGGGTQLYFVRGLNGGDVVVKLGGIVLQMDAEATDE